MSEVARVARRAVLQRDAIARWAKVRGRQRRSPRPKTRGVEGLTTDKYVQVSPVVGAEVA